MNLYIYRLVTPLLPQPNQAHHSFVLVDTSNTSLEQVYRITQEIQSYTPKEIIMDISHQKIDQKALKRFEAIAPKALYIFPSFKIEKYKNYQGNIKFYDFEHLYIKERKSNLHIYNDLTTSSDNETKMYQNFSINYNGKPKFSKVHSRDFFEKNTVPQLFRNKTVIISNFDNRYAPYTGFLDKDETFIHQSHLAFMLKSQQDKSWLKTFNPLSYTLFISITILIWIYFVYFTFSKYQSLNYSFLLSFVLPMISYWILLAYWNFLLPISEIVVFLSMVTVELVRHWEKLKDQEETSILNNLTKRLQDKVVHKTFFNSDEYWKDIMLLLNELFYLEKNIILEKVEGYKHLKEVASYRCDFSDVGEMRRDYTREPYLSSLEHQSVMKPSRDFFENLSKGEEEFIVPLYYHHKVIGFWIFSIKLSNKMENFKLLVHDYAKEVSHLLFNRSQFIQNKKDSSKDIKKLLTVKIKPKVIQNIERNLTIIEKRMLMDEVILDAISAQMIVYDLFGRVLHINNPMAQTLQEEQVSAFTMTESEMIAKVTSIDLAKIKKIIREVISTQQPYRQLVTLKHSQKKYILNISAITKKSIDNKFTIDYFFDSCGIICEFHDFSYIEHRYYYKKDIINYAMDSNEKRLSKINQLTPDTKELSKILHDTLFAFNKLKTLINQDIISKGGDDLYPQNIRQIIELAWHTTRQNYTQKPIEFEINSSSDLPLALISINNAQKNMQNLLVMLMDDSQEYGTISIDIKAKEYTLEITMKSYGSGMPQKQLDNYLNSSIPPQKYRLIQKTQKGIAQAMGSLECFSQLGNGVRIQLTLKSVSL